MQQQLETAVNDWLASNLTPTEVIQQLTNELPVVVRKGAHSALIRFMKEQFSGVIHRETGPALVYFCFSDGAITCVERYYLDSIEVDADGNEIDPAWADVDDTIVD